MNHLTNPSVNKIAWIGQASCCFAFGSTSLETKKAWNTLREEKKENANNIAKIALEKWGEYEEAFRRERL